MQPDAIPLIPLTGDAYERGLTHGRVCADEIHQILADWRRHVAPAAGSADAYREAFRSRTDFLKGFQDHAPHLIDELRGIAEGARVPFGQILDLQLLDEEWWFRQLYSQTSAAHPHHCSALALRTTGGGVLVAQNFDGASWMEGYQRVFHHRDPVTGLDALIFSLPGILALNGINRHGVAVCVNSLVQLDGDPCGLPVVGVIRRLLEAPDQPAAVATLRSVRHASGQTYTLGDSRTFGAFEVSRSSIVEVGGLPRLPAVCHTNHPLANPDTGLFQRATAGDTPERRLARTANSAARLAALEQGLGDSAAYSVDGVKALLASRRHPDHPLSRELGGGGEVIDYTLACLVFEPGPPALMHLAAGPPSTTGFRTFICDSGVAPLARTLP
ncbi:MAG TPA: C45 family autoproteolytic acyltransferase/hydrolase [Caulobacter sp.]|nr:C45 family autoproteolytic acyltransferase/hydrolase [Caulobacter sp.]